MPRRALWLGSALAVSCGLLACASEDRGDRAPPESDAGPAATELEVGYGEAPLGWRVGAKPGQVGTAALPERDQLLVDSVGTLLPILQSDTLTEAEVARQMTDWLMTTLEERVQVTEPGKYAHLWEPGRGIELPPMARAIVIRSGEEKIALVRADLYIMHEHLHRRIADLVSAATGLERDRIFLVATHNHSTPHALSAAAGVWILADAFDPRHFVYASRQIASAIIAADAELQPAELRVVKSEIRSVQRNVIGPGQSEVENPDGALEAVSVGYPRDYFDPDLLMVRFDRPDSTDPIASLFIFGMHPESLPSGHGITSGEWPTHVEEILEERLGAPFVWMPGPLGDSEPDDGAVEPTHGFFRGGFETMAQMVDLVVSSAEDAFRTAGGEEGERRPMVQQVATDLPGTADFPLPTSEYLGDGLRLPMLRLIEDSAVYRLHVIRLGDAVLFGAPAEITTDLALNIKSRVDRVDGNVHQGYVWDDAPAWVRERIGKNFGTDELGADEGLALPMIVSHANGYMGYIVTAWEYESHSHYREDMTALGPGTADHVASAFVEMARSLGGTEPYQPELPDWHMADLEGVETVAAFLQGLDERVPAMARAFPITAPTEVGSVVTEPLDTARGNNVSFSFMGGTNDMEPPVIVLERQEGGSWTPLARGPSGEIWVLYEGDSLWTAVWNHAEADSATPLRFRVEGTYRGAEPGAGPVHPLFDPDGANQSYTATSATFAVTP
jgi:hypothetical protein